MTSVFLSPRYLISAAMSSAIASKVIGRLISAVRPWACKSAAITCRPCESTGRSG